MYKYFSLKKLLFFGLLLITVSCSTKKYDNPHIVIYTDFGKIEAELYPKKAPKTVAAFLSYIDKGLYNNGNFYRVMKDETLSEEYNSGFIQGGIIKSNPTLQKTMAGIEMESPKNTGLSNTSGAISFARVTNGKATTEFFICIGDQKQLDGGEPSANNDGLGYAVIGKVVKGMKVVRKIQNSKSMGDAIIYPVVIHKITKL